ncbi:DUF1523 family protein [Thalassospira xianhensis]|uniref:DUF1523 domain-containing protein n=1 Tax=Thalassospira xianhensis MCCC 1A02616 TaxID=1177929 RepID=A0A367UHP2_9PROT|nr:DUF1523 family protein [Thalassospira xianhensis]RCK07728.1 hypothetical protein TH5_01280 [Thalassospira xianhensis MCCC 1A02616]
MTDMKTDGFASLRSAFRVTKMIVLVSLVLVGGAFLHYITPRGEVVVLTGADVVRFDDDHDSASTTTSSREDNQKKKSRDVRINSAQTLDGKSVRSYRNEDNNFYLKWDSGSVQSEVNAILLNQSRSPELLHTLVYRMGWRIEPVLGWYPNMLSVEVVPADYVYYPVREAIFVSVVFAILAAVALVIWRTIRFVRKEATDTVTKVRNSVSQTVDDITETVMGDDLARGNASTAARNSSRGVNTSSPRGRHRREGDDDDDFDIGVWAGADLSSRSYRGGNSDDAYRGGDSDDSKSSTGGGYTGGYSGGSDSGYSSDSGGSSD